MSSFSEIAALSASADPEDRRRGVELLEAAEVGNRAQCIVAAMADSDWRVRKEAVRVALALAPAADMLSQLITPFLRSEDVGQRNSVVEALAAYGQGAVSALAQNLDAFDVDARKLAAEVLGNCRESSALKLLEQLLQDPDVNVRLAAIEAVSCLGSVNQEAAANLLEQALKAKDPWLRLAALGGLNQLGLLVPWDALTRLLSDPILLSTVRVSLGRSRDERAVPILIAELAGPDTKAANEALVALAELSQTSSSVRLRIQAELGSASAAVAALMARAQATVEDLDLRKAAVLLCGLGSNVGVAEFLVAQLTDSSVAEEVEAALVALGQPATRALLAAVRADESLASTGLLEVLGRLPRQADSEASQLLASVLQEQESPRVRAALAAAVTHGDESLLPRLLPWLRQGVRVRRIALQALVASTERFGEAARDLAARVGGGEPLVWATVVATLGAPVSSDLEVDVRQLRHWLTSDDTSLRKAAVEGLAALGVPSAVEVLELALTDEEYEVRVAALGALGRARANDGSAPGATHLILLIARNDEDALLLPALRALGKTNDSRALGVLRPFLKSPQAVRALAAVDAIFGLSQSGRSQVLRDALDHPAADVVKRALESVVGIAEPEAAFELSRCLEHTTRDVRRFAAELAAKVSGVDPELLRTRLRLEHDPQVHAALFHALCEIETRASVRRSLVPSAVGGPRGT